MHSASGYFIKRRVRATEPWKTVVYHRFAKLGVVCDTRDHFILAYQVGRGPRPTWTSFGHSLPKLCDASVCRGWWLTPAMTRKPIMFSLATSIACIDDSG